MRGCLYNVRQDPSESHDLWDRGTKVAASLISKLQVLWEMQMKRGPPALDARSDPANFEYRWVPWLNDTDPVVNTTNSNANNSFNNDINNLYVFTNPSALNNRPAAAIVSCDRTHGLRNLLCVLGSIF